MPPALCRGAGVIDKAIDPARTGLSKSLLTNPCERKGYYQENVRDEAGNRLSFPMPERVLFGRFIDAIHAFIVSKDRMESGWHPDEAVLLGLQHATSIEASEDIDWNVFALQGRNAIELFLSQPEGLARMRESYGRNLRFQGANGRSLRTDDIVGTPDYIDDLGPIDVKSTGRSFDSSKFYRSAEMPLYALLWSAEHGGEIPQRLAYQTYVRKAKPEWKWLETPGTSAHIELGRLYANRWRKGLAAGDPDLFSFDTTYCGDCPFRNPLPDVGHAGCPIGLLVPERQEEEAA